MKDENTQLDRIETTLSLVVSNLVELKTDVAGLKTDMSEVKQELASVRELAETTHDTLLEYIDYQETINSRILDMVGDEKGLAAAHSELASHETRIHRLELAQAA
jgi:uncharacterized coiled-coil DUF342 family protein